MPRLAALPFNDYPRVDIRSSLLLFAVEIFIGLVAIVTAYRGASTLFSFRPVRATVVYNGYRRERHRADGAFLRDNAPPMPLTVVDRIRFEDYDNQTIHCDITRLAIDHGDTLLVWYSPQIPTRVRTAGPLRLVAISAALICLLFVL